MSKKARSAGAQNRAAERKKDLQKAEKRRALERERAEAQRKKTVELIRSGKLKLKKAKPQKGLHSLASSLPHQSPIRREDVVIDENTRPKNVPNQYKLEGDTGW
ncbi:hypothetical protein RDI61_01590 [Pseudomonas plecoglossicida]|uniref:hypothetical protein n=1 Tax=Pseudomonas putida group TaxID=136845 RepID=UPI00241048CD|nr:MULTISPECIES: hypothetical protein [Pseudomonas putida group]MDQ7962744.1 hypothetical protein [Pseudomonas plecoglossicida]WFG05258.1 hypothetical protein P3X84_11720 [Pseudomonas putida]HDS0942040.1 hypothetical protein [Pseudomonas putida]